MKPQTHQKHTTKLRLLPFTATLLLVASMDAPAATRYVNLNNPAPAPPYTDWTSAATNIQDAIDIAAAGEEIVVTNGVYASGGRAVSGTMTNRVALTKALTVRSVNGPQFTIIEGRQVPGTGTGDGAIRCVYLINGAILSGFTLTNGATRNSGGDVPQQSGGGLWCESTNALVMNCAISGNLAEKDGGGAYSGTLDNCTFANNSAGDDGGGVAGGLLNHCDLINNVAGDDGGGAERSLLNNCTLTGNTAQDRGGGAYAGSLINCALAENSAASGGGASAGSPGGTECFLSNCTLARNSSKGFGGGAYGAVLDNCVLTENLSLQGGGAAAYGTLRNSAITGNSAEFSGGGVAYATLNNCTLTGNSARDYGGGGVVGSVVNNCIVFHNTAASGVGPNYIDCSLNYTCTTPLPTNGVGNIAIDPQLADVFHLSAESPCRGVGSASFARGVDVDGEAWADPPSIGCDEFRTGAVTGPLTVAGDASYTHVAAGFAVDFRARIEGRVNASRWEFGDGTVVSNQAYVSHRWLAPGSYDVVLRAYNETYSTGVSATVTVHVVESPVHHVSLDSGSPSAPYNSWATAARNIQEAIDATTVPGALVLVSNGVYKTGGRVVSGTTTNRIALTKPSRVRSVNGPEVTVISGSGVMRCAYLTNGAMLEGFTVTNGVADDGGGVWSRSSDAVVFNCKLVGNSAQYNGGGAYSGTLNNSTLTGNSAQNNGGGAFGATLNNSALAGNSAANSGGGVYSGALNNCTLTGNSAGYEGGGADSSALNNCLVYYNSVVRGSGPNYASSRLNYSCTTPLPESGVGNITSEPQLASPSHLSTSSPCIGAGSAAFVSGADIDGEPWANPPSIGCDEHHQGNTTGPLTVAIAASYTNVATGFVLDLRGQIDGRVSSSRWEFGDGTITSNQPYARHSWMLAGDYPVVLRAYNDSYPMGISVTAAVHVAEAPVHFVALNSGNPVPPYNSWATAARSIQDAIDAAGPGAVVLVGNGVYQSGGRALDGTTNRVAVSKPVTVQSVNGSQMTVISGGGAMRCVYLANDATLAGFTLANGMAGAGGGVWCESASAVLTKCTLSGNLASVLGGGAYSGTLNNCVLTGNTVLPDGIGGGGAFGSTLNDCTVSGNLASEHCTDDGCSSWGGGAISSTLNRCTLTRNSAVYGGGAWDCMLTNCTLMDNVAGYDGGGTIACTLNNCILVGNRAYSGGGAQGGELYNCILVRNTATGSGGGAYFAKLVNCTLFSNSARYLGGGMSDCHLTNGIAYYNTVTEGLYANYIGGTLAHSCTTPLSTNGVGNFTNAPLFLDHAGGNLRLQSGSPCINAGRNSDAPASSDLDGQPRIVGGTVDIGAYEFQSPQSNISYAWLQQFGLPTDGLADNEDSDGDSHSSFQEWRAGTNPTNALSVLRLLTPVSDISSVAVSWQSVSKRTYFLDRSTNLPIPIFLPWVTNVVGQPGITTLTDSNRSGVGPVLYRVGVQE